MACGGHAGDASSMAATAEACAEAGARLGAHPSYPDREGFGRRRSSLSATAVAEAVCEQVAELSEHAAAAGTGIESIKPHGRLYHDLSSDPELAEAVLSALRDAGHGRIVLAAGSRAIDVAAELGLSVDSEGFADRRYGATGALLERSEPGAVLADPEEAAAQAVALATRGIETATGRVLVDSICVHSDSPGAPATLASVSAALRRAGVLLGRRP